MTNTKFNRSEKNYEFRWKCKAYSVSSNNEARIFLKSLLHRNREIFIISALK